jgi:large subunit ribosomal protein L24
MNKLNNKISKTKLKVGDSIIVISGDHKGEKGSITKFFNKKNSVIVEGVNLVTKHNKPSASNPKGGISKKEAPVHISNVMFVEDEKAVKIGYKFVDNKKVRYSKRSNNEV